MSLEDRLAAIKEKANAHEEALEMNEARDAQREAPAEAIKENDLRDELKSVNENFAVVGRELIKSESKIDEARNVLKELDPNSEDFKGLSESIDEFEEDIKQKYQQLKELSGRIKILEGEIAALNENPELKGKIEAARDINEFISVLQSVDAVTSSSGEMINTQVMIEAIKPFANMKPGKLSVSRDNLDKYFASKGITSTSGIREKLIDLIFATETSQQPVEDSGEVENISVVESVPAAEAAPVAEEPVVVEVPSVEVSTVKEEQSTIPESPEVIQTKKLIERIKEGRLEKSVSIESRNAAARKTIEEVRATGNIEGIDFSQPGMRANLSMILEQKIATPDQILLQVGNKPGIRAEFLSALSPAETAQLKGSRFFEQAMNLAMGDLLSNLQVADVKKSSRIGTIITSLFQVYGLYKADKLILGVKFDENKSKIAQIKNEIVAGLSNPDLARGAFFVDPESAAFIFENKLLPQEELVGRLKAAVGSSKERNMFEASVATIVELQEKGYLSEKEVGEVLGI